MNVQNKSILGIETVLLPSFETWECFRVLFELMLKIMNRNNFLTSLVMVVQNKKGYDFCHALVDITVFL